MEAREDEPSASQEQMIAQPCDLEAERIVLGAMLWDRGFAADMLLMLQAKAFCSRANALIFKTMKRLHETSPDITWQGLFLELGSSEELKEAGGKEYLSGLVSRRAFHSHAAHYASIIMGKAFLRELVRSLEDVSRQTYVYKANAEEVLDYAQEELCRLSQKYQVRHFLSAQEILSEYQVACGPQKADRLDFIPAGFSQLDKLAGGFRRGELTVLTGRAAHGKTLFALSCALNAGQSGVPVLIFSPETSTWAFTNKMLRVFYGLGCVAGNEPPSGENMPLGVARLFAGFPLYVSDSRQYVDKISACAKQLAARLEKEAQQRLGLIVVDCLSLLKTTQKGDSAKIILQRLRELAGTLDVAVLALHRCEQSVDQAAEIRISSIKDSAAVEEIADTICLLYRERQNDGICAEESASLSILKQRNGPLGMVHFGFNAKKFRFKEKAVDKIPPGTCDRLKRAVSWLIKIARFQS